jgi:hypothetical protein
VICWLFTRILLEILILQGSLRDIFIRLSALKGKGSTLLVGRSRDRSAVVSLGIFSVVCDISMCPGSTQPLKNEYQDTLGGKDGVWLTTYLLQVPMSRILEP